MIKECNRRDNYHKNWKYNRINGRTVNNYLFIVKFLILTFDHQFFRNRRFFNIYLFLYNYIIISLDAIERQSFCSDKSVNYIFSLNPHYGNERNYLNIAKEALKMRNDWRNIIKIEYNLRIIHKIIVTSFKFRQLRIMS